MRLTSRELLDLSSGEIKKHIWKMSFLVFYKISKKTQISVFYLHTPRQCNGGWEKHAAYAPQGRKIKRFEEKGGNRQKNTTSSPLVHSVAHDNKRAQGAAATYNRQILQSGQKFDPFRLTRLAKAGGRSEV